MKKKLSSISGVKILSKKQQSVVVAGGKCFPAVDEDAEGHLIWYMIDAGGLVVHCATEEVVDWIVSWFD